ncbi:DinB family protein [Hufsiella ginkgonis]|uniref:DinB family protein n=1 Tax=Hufsiella ginkgonis TaxID=2695274 RepID=A0A7K1XV37_9SPHI|nr:DinB family protein [Hufsiella ginkgonis]MXV14844.1 DinB family protein [Hufsiella ginkgonis]
MDQQELFVKMAVHAWNVQIGRAEKMFNAFSDDDFYREIAPGKNRIIYLYGHLIAIHDAIKDILVLGDRRHADMDDPYIKKPEDKSLTVPSLAEMKQYWAEVHAELAALFQALPAAEWFTRHKAMSDEDFVKDPSRNKLSVLMNRTSHVAYHLGQIVLVKPNS